MSAAPATPVFVVLEGLDGAGKTTCASILAELLGAACMTTPSSQVRQYRQHILDSFGTSREAAQLFYLSTVFSASDQVGEMLAAGKSVVMDRYFLSTQAYAEFRGSRLPLDAINGLLVPAHLTVYLNASPDIRRQRLQDRGCTADDRATLSSDAYRQLDTLHREKAGLPVVGRWLEIDNAGADPRTAVQCILAAIEKMAGAR